ncbi:MAG: hypothetical protein PHV18_04305 [Lachnospiraceae bacterium]|nr:hypothetical protein [Lachnospiraceae bacterium]
MSTKTAAETATEDTKSVEKTATKCYIGPSTLGIISGTIYNAELPPLLKEAIKELPIISNLVVPVNELAAANMALGSPNSAMSRFYSVARDYFKNKRKEGK